MTGLEYTAVWSLGLNYLCFPAAVFVHVRLPTQAGFNLREAVKLREFMKLGLPGAAVGEKRLPHMAVHCRVVLPVYRQAVRCGCHPVHRDL